MDELLEEAIRGFFFEKHMTWDTIDEWTAEIMTIISEHRTATTDLDGLPGIVLESPHLADASALCGHLADLLEARGAKRPTVSQAWLRDMEALLRIDGREPDAVRRVLDWLQAERDPTAAFWKPNIRSPKKLRMQWDRMAEQYAQKRRASGGSTLQERFANNRAVVEAALGGE